MVAVKPTRLTISLKNRTMPHLNFLYIVRRYAFGDPSPFDVGPPIPAVPVDQHEPVAFHHAPFHVTARFVVIQRFDVLQFLCPSSRGDCRPNPLGRHTAR